MKTGSGILTSFFRGTMESVRASCITVWFGNCKASERSTLQCIVRTAEKILGVSLSLLGYLPEVLCTQSLLHHEGPLQPLTMNVRPLFIPMKAAQWRTSWVWKYTDLQQLLHPASTSCGPWSKRPRDSSSSSVCNWSRADYFRSGALLAWMGIKRFNLTALQDFPNVIRHNESNPDVSLDTKEISTDL